MSEKIFASGGAVRDPEFKLLFMIFRNGKWDLPKGKDEKGESHETAALREVQEECGFNDLKIIRPLGTTQHGYQLYHKTIEKTTFWFEMISRQTQFTLQQEEGITEGKWVNRKEAAVCLQNSYSTIREVVEKLSWK